MANRDHAQEGTSTDPVGGLRWVPLDQTFDVDGLYSLRSALVAHGSELGASETELERLVLVASELATNAIRHGGGSGRLRLWRTDSAIVCEVSDRGAGISDAGIGAVAVSPSAVGGRGIWICRQLSASLTIAAGHPGAIVTVSIEIAGSS